MDRILNRRAVILRGISCEAPRYPGNGHQSAFHGDRAVPDAVQRHHPDPASVSAERPLIIARDGRPDGRVRRPLRHEEWNGWRKGSDRVVRKQRSPRLDIRQHTLHGDQIETFPEARDVAPVHATKLDIGKSIACALAIAVGDRSMPSTRLLRRLRNCAAAPLPQPISSTLAKL